MIPTELPWHTDTLRAELARLERLPHALLLRGAPGIGKSRYAQALAAALLCESPASDRRACGRCDACGWFRTQTHPDARLLTRTVDDEGKQSAEIRIEQVRALAEFLTVGGHRGGRRVVVIDPADAMNTFVGNALLKTLEEPGEGLVFLLVSSRPDAIAATLRSRCQVRALPGPSETEACAWIREATGCSPQEAVTWLAMAGAAPLHATAFAEPSRAAAHRAVLETIAGLPETSMQSAADSLQGADARLWVPLLQRWLMDLGRCRTGAAPRYFPAWSGRLGELAIRVEPQSLVRAAAGLSAQYRLVEHPLNPRLFCEATIESYLEAFGSQDRAQR